MTLVLYLTEHKTFSLCPQKMLEFSSSFLNSCINHFDHIPEDTYCRTEVSSHFGIPATLHMAKELVMPT